MSFKINKYPKSRELFDRATKVIPSGVYGHLGPAEGCFIPVSAFPLFGDKAKGTYFWDVDGNRFIDYMCAYGPNVLGYCDDDVDAAALSQAKIGNCTTSPPKLMVELAELMVDTGRWTVDESEAQLEGYRDYMKRFIPRAMAPHELLP